MLHLYYANLQSNSEKSNFINEVCQKCRVNYPTVRSWIVKPGASTYRNPKPVYRPIIAEITGIPENKLFKN